MFKKFIKNNRLKRYYRKKIKTNTLDYFISIHDGIDRSDIGWIKELLMRSGETGKYKLYDCRVIDEIASENLKFDFLGYKGKKSIRDCTFREFKEIYSDYIR